MAAYLKIDKAYVEAKKNVAISCRMYVHGNVYRERNGTGG